jgi:hypothetical protein
MRKWIIGVAFSAMATLIPMGDAFAKAHHHIGVYNPRFH